MAAGTDGVEDEEDDEDEEDEVVVVDTGERYSP
jgi:hypothetical protein